MISKFIEIHTPEEIEIMREVSKINLDIISRLGDQIRVGMSTKDLDNLSKQFMQEVNVEPAFLNYKPSNANTPFPSYACWCLNAEVFHSPASPIKVIRIGDLVTIDQGIKYKGLFSDCAETYLVGGKDVKKLNLIEACRTALKNVLPLCVPGNNTKDLTKSIDSTIRSFGFAPIENFGGHGIGSQMHMAPFVGNSTKQMMDCELADGMTLAIEPACSFVKETPAVLNDGWTVTLSKDNLSAHVERVVAVTKSGGIILQ